MKKTKNIVAGILIAGVVATVALAMRSAPESAQNGSPAETASSEAIRSFKVHFPDADLKKLRKRIRATQWPEEET
ncbi:MAG: epoxide hydrolase, partial [Cytophagales bacterium]|nr:epoxide hydrolase [Cytophagales bacterium]